MKKAIALICFIIIIGTILFVPLFQVISFTETRTINPQMYYIDVDKEKRFHIRFTHSIHLTDVMETYEVVENNKIRLISMEYEDVAVGMPAYAEEGQRLTYEDGKYTLTYTDAFLENFVLYIGDINMDLFFYFAGEAFDLKKSLQRGKSYLVEVKRVSLYDKMKGVLITNEKEG